REQPAALRQPARMKGLQLARPVYDGAAETVFAGGIGNRRIAGSAKSGMALHLAPASVAHRLGQYFMEIDEEKKGLRGPMLLPHEEHGNRRCQQKDGTERRECRRIGEMDKALAETAVADLIVILQKIDECRRRQSLGRFSP